jgi:glycosyltransferase involved in cell wall biosynthesis
MNQPTPTLRILGIRGVPAAHGGFETFAERLALDLAQRGWRVIVYCQHEGNGPLRIDEWQGVERVHIAVKGDGPASTIRFDWASTLHAAKHDDLCLVLGYNTAAFMAALRLRGVTTVINMDGIEWSRAKWGTMAKTWFWLNERAGAWLGNYLVADHPEIARHLATRASARKIHTIAYGADRVEQADVALVERLGLRPGQYASVIARPEPENSLLEIVRAFSRRRRGKQLAVLGNYSAANAYHQEVKRSASDEVLLLGAIYDQSVVAALRVHSAVYVHGHQVGGTNPSLVEALGAGNAVIAHDNPFNRWVAGPGAEYFGDESALAECFDRLLDAPASLCAMQQASVSRHQEAFQWPDILARYRALLEHAGRFS